MGLKGTRYHPGPAEAERILIAEDSPMQSEQLRALLEDAGYRVEAAPNGRAGLTAARANPPNLIISDVNMPEMDGYEFCRQMKSDSALKDIPFIIVTSLSAPIDVVHGLECGADNFITKPYTEITLLERVRYLLTNNALRATSKVRTGIEIELGGKVHYVTAERHQMLDLLISTYAEAVRLNEEAAKQAEELRESYQTMAALHRSAEELNKTLTVAEVVAAVQERIQELSFCRASWILLTDDDGIVRDTHGSGLSESEIAAMASASICACQRDIHLGKIRSVTTVEDCARLRAASLPTAPAHACIPLIGHERNFGALNVLPKAAEGFADDELRVLAAIGIQVTTALDRAHLTSTLERQVAARTQELRREVEERRRAEAAAVAMTGRLERAQRIASIGSVDQDLATGRVYWSDELRRIFGFSQSAVPSLDAVRESVIEEDRPILVEAQDRTTRGEKTDPVEIRIRRADGEVRWLRRDAEYIADASGQGAHIAATYHDFTERRIIEERLRVADKRIREVLDTASDGIISIDEGQRIVIFNAAAEAIFGYKADEVIGQPLTILLPPDSVGLHTDHVEGFLRGPDMKRTMGGRRQLFGRRKDGAMFRAEVGISKSTATRAVLATAVVRDVTQNYNLEEQLRQAQKMEAVGNLTGGIAHDFNNILAVIIGNLDLLKLEVPGGSEADSLVETSINACLKGSELTKSLLAFSRRQPLQPKRTQVNKLLSDGVKMMSRTIGGTVEVHLRLGDGVWDVMIDPALLESALLNMMVNSRDAMPDGGHIVIETRNTALDANYVDQNPGVTAGEYVVLEVSDTGSGMPPEILARVFEPFFTTKEKGKGTGLGLAMVFGFVKQSGGHIKIYSEVGHGTTIRIYLPRIAADAGPLQETARSAATSLGGVERILVVEDGAQVRQGVVKQLSGAGYRITEAENAVLAIEALEKGLQVDLVFSDVIMPGGMTGADLARQIGKRWPKIKVLLTSGFPEGLLENGSKLPPGVNLLSKPYRRDDLLRKIRETLDG